MCRKIRDAGFLAGHGRARDRKEIPRHAWQRLQNALAHSAKIGQSRAQASCWIYLDRRGRAPTAIQRGLPMTKIMSSLFLGILLGLCPHVASAQAQLVRTCVSMAKGNDANSASNCHCTTPCRTFAVAHANTFSDGEITVLDPGDYGGLTITKSISINNDSGGAGSITGFGGGIGILVQAPAGGYVNLRGITIQGVEFG